MSDREQFEAWVRSKDAAAPMYRRDVKGSERIGQYCTHWIQDQWESWQASRRAALEEAAVACDDVAKARSVVEMAVGAKLCVDAIRKLAKETNNG